MDKTILQLVVIIPTFLIFGVILLALKLKTGRSLREIMADRDKLFLYSLGTAFVVLFVLAAILVIRNN